MKFSGRGVAIVGLLVVGIAISACTAKKGGDEGSVTL